VRSKERPRSNQVEEHGRKVVENTVEAVKDLFLPRR
jgi:hypothetical protein